MQTRNSIRGFVRPLVRHARVLTLGLKTRKTRIHDAAIVIVCVWVCECVAGVVGGGVGVKLGVGCPCPPVRNDIVTPRHLFSIRIEFIRQRAYEGNI